MADRYWVGGTNSWSAANTGSWSDTSGGTGGFSVPTASDNVFFDVNSGDSNTVITVTSGGGGRSCLNFTWDYGFAGTMSGSGGAPTINVYGNMELSGNGAFAPEAFPVVIFRGNGITHTIISNTQSFGRVFFFGDADSRFELLDDFQCYDSSASTVVLDAGTLQPYGAVTVRKFSTSGSAAKVLNLGNVGWNITGGSEVVWDVRTGPLQLNKETADIYLSSNAGVNRTFYTGGYDYNRIAIGGQGGAYGYTYFAGGASFTELYGDKEAPTTVFFEGGQTYNIDLISLTGYYNNQEWSLSLANAIDATQTGGIYAYYEPTNYPGDSLIKIDNEVMSYSTYEYNPVVGLYEYSGIVRGVNGTSAESHDANSLIYTPYFITYDSTDHPARATIITKTPSGIFYGGSNSYEVQTSGVVLSSLGGSLDYNFYQYINFIATKSGVMPTVGASGVSNQIRTTPGNAVGVMGRTYSPAVGGGVGGNGVIDLYTGVD